MVAVPSIRKYQLQSFTRLAPNTGYQLLFAVLNNIRGAPIFRDPHMIAPRLPGVKVLYLPILVDMVVRRLLV